MVFAHAPAMLTNPLDSAPQKRSSVPVSGEIPGGLPPSRPGLPFDTGYRAGRTRHRRTGAWRCEIARIVVFAFDLTEAAQVRRIVGLIGRGHSVTSFSFRRGNMDAEAPDWPNVDLGPMPNRRFLVRTLLLLRALPRVLGRAGALRDAEVIVARNFDLLCLALVARAMVRGCRARLVYECLDIHSLFTAPGPAGRVMRLLERSALGRIDLLWTSSPGFVRSYFVPVQGYRGPYALIENKLWFEGPPPARPRPGGRRSRRAPLVLGWVGSIRCAPSLDILARTAEALGPDIEIAIHGNLHRHAIPGFDRIVAERSNMRYRGPYAYPGDLEAIYLGCDAVWAQDLWQRGGNSDWLLPNRIYEASWFGCPSIAVAGTETGRRVAAADLGLVIEAPTGEALIERLRTLDAGAFAEMSDRLLDMPDTDFRLDGSDIDAALAPVLSPPLRGASADAPGESALPRFGGES